MTRPLMHIDSSRYRLKNEVVTREVEALITYPFKSLTIPGLTDEEYAELLESVRAEGVRPSHPLVVTPAGLVVDGRARLRAAKQAGIPTVPTQVLEAPGEADYALWATREALARRHLSSFQRFALVQAALAILEAQARASQRVAQFRAKAPNEPTAAGAQKAESATVGPNLDRPSAPAGRTREQAALLVGVSTGQAGKMVAVEKRGSPELKEAVRAGRMSVHQAYESLPGRQKKRNGQGRAASAAERLADAPVPHLLAAKRALQRAARCCQVPEARQRIVALADSLDEITTALQAVGEPGVATGEGAAPAGGE